MSNSWPKVSFEALYAEPSKNGIYKSKEFHGTGAKIVNMGELFGYEFIGPQEMKRVQMTEAELTKSGLQNGDLLFGRRSLVEEGAGKCSIVKNLDENTTFESSLIRVRLDKTKAMPEFYYYWFKSHVGRSGIKAIVTGTNVKGIKSSALKTISVVQPDLKTQKLVVNVISKYDELIENNKRRIELLEESARQLYKEWFVRLRFPGHEHAKIVNGVPTDWMKIKIKDAVQRIPAGQRFSQKTALAKGSVPILDQGKSGVIGYHNEKPSVLASITKPVIVFANHTCNQRIIHYPFSTIQNVLPFLPSSSVPKSVYWLHHATDGVIKLNGYKGHWPEFESKEILVPHTELVKLFSANVAPAYQQINVLEESIKALQAARNLLLPKLMSGELAV